MLESSTYWSILMVLTTFMEWAVLNFIFNNISTVRRSKKIVYLCLIAIVSIMVFMTHNNYMVNFKITICIILSFLLFKFNYDTSIFQGILISTMFWTILTVNDLVVCSILVILHSLDNINLLLANNVYRLELVIITKSILLLAIPIIKSIKCTFKINKKEYLLLAIPILANVMSLVAMVFFIFDKSIIVTTNIGMVILVVSLFLLFSNVSFIFIVLKIVKANELRYENKLIKDKMYNQYKHYLSLEKAQFGLETLFETQNNVLDLILTEKKSICDENDIELCVNIDFSQCYFLEVIDICNLFSNMLDRAIDTEQKSKKNLKKITISGKIVNNFYVIKCTNSAEYLKIVKNIVRDEQETFSHEIGVNSINKTIEKYNGVVQISDDNLVLTILIPLSQKVLQPNKST
ncbi:GHKL domain-containing protein [Metaclostridioides mangenotii]|uniref:GHKL domain-containing protein n=1 Tax=Metaclostridioides mangenotii TaxID=1540 RepID=UPI0028F0E557|nr:GHKL domain-containing protein [Clostridioides mangenotii]